MSTTGVSPASFDESAAFSVLPKAPIPAGVMFTDLATLPSYAPWLVPFKLIASAAGFLSDCISVQLTDRRNSFLAEEPLDVCIKTGALKEAVAQKQHTIAIISGKKF